MNSLSLRIHHSISPFPSYYLLVVTNVKYHECNRHINILFNNILDDTNDKYLIIGSILNDSNDKEWIIEDILDDTNDKYLIIGSLLDDLNDKDLVIGSREHPG